MRHLTMVAALFLGFALAFATPANAQKRDRYIITAEEIAEKPDITNGYEAVQRLRPRWLRVVRTRASTGVPQHDHAGGAILYVNELRQPEIEDLRNIRVEEIWEIKYIVGSKAKVLWNMDHEDGAIMVTTMRYKP